MFELFDIDKCITKEFVCKDDDINQYVNNQLYEDLNKRLVGIYVNLCEKNNVKAFYTLSACSVPKNNFPRKIKQEYQYRELPFILIGRLGRDNKYDKDKLGLLAIKDATKRALSLSSQLGSLGLVVEAKNEKLLNWYKELGFTHLFDHKLFYIFPKI